MALFEGVNLDDDEPDYDDYEDDQYESLDRQEQKEKIRKLVIDNETKLNNLVAKDMVKAILLEMGHQIQTAFVDLPRREAPNIAAKLGIPNLERDLEKELSDLIKTALDSCINNIDKLSQDRIFE